MEYEILQSIWKTWSLVGWFKTGGDQTEKLPEGGNEDNRRWERKGERKRERKGPRGSERKEATEKFSEWNKKFAPLCSKVATDNNISIPNPILIREGLSF